MFLVVTLVSSQLPIVMTLLDLTGLKPAGEDSIIASTDLLVSHLLKKAFVKTYSIGK